MSNVPISNDYKKTQENTGRKPIMRRFGVQTVSLSLVLVLLGGMFSPKLYASSPAVVPVNWSSFTAGRPTDANSVRIGAILGNTNKYALTTWYNSVKQFSVPAQQTATYLNLGGTDEAHIRPVASEALALAVSLKTGLYNPSLTGVDTYSATTKAAKLIRSLAYFHAANHSGGWGNTWQSALWASYAGQAGWLMWDSPYLTAQDRQNIQKMVEYEANRFIGYSAPYYQNPSGTILTPGDSKAEENAWNAMVLQLAAVMMPNDASIEAWNYKAEELMVSSFARPQDVSSTTVVNGRALTDWLYGSNANSDGTVVNHGILHPDYMSTISENDYAGLVDSLARKPTPEAAFFNSDITYAALVDLQFVAGTPRSPGPATFAPGGTIYVPNSSNIYYPQGDDWGTSRRMQFALSDAEAGAFGFDTLASKKGSYWEPFHAQMVLNMQNANPDRRTYTTAAQDTYSGREEWVAVYAAQAYLAKWLVAQKAFSKTTATVPIVVDNLDREFTTPSGSWTVSIPPGQLGTNNRYAAAGTGSATARFTPRLTNPGTYKVYAWWSAYTNHATNTPYVVQGSTGTSTVLENQQASGGQWNLLGTYNFAAGNSGYVEVNNAANGYVVADAVMFVAQ